MQELQIFNYESREVRTVKIDGDIFWVAKDVCDILDLSNVTESLRRVDDDDRTSVVINSGGQDREMFAINESGLYCLIFESRKPEAKKFKKWVTSEVLPSIRKTGSYLSKNDLITTEIKSLYDKVNSMSKEIKNFKKLLTENKKPQTLEEIKSFFNVIEYSQLKQYIIVEYNNDLFLINNNNNFTIYIKQRTETGVWESNWQAIDFRLGSLKKGLEYILKMY